MVTAAMKASDEFSAYAVRREYGIVDEASFAFSARHS
jgi:hypothetical protein